MQRVNQLPAYTPSQPNLMPRQVIQSDTFRQSFKQMPDKENSYAQLQKRKLQQVYPTYQSTQGFQKSEMRPSSSQQRQPSVQAIPRPSSASKEIRSYSGQKQPRASFKELKNSAFVQPPQGYQQRYFSLKGPEIQQKGMVKSQSNQQLAVQPIDKQEYKKLHEKLQFLEKKINKIKSNIEISNNQIEKQSERKKPQGLAAKFFQKREDTDQQNSQQSSQLQEAPIPTPKNQPSLPTKGQSVNLDQFVTQVKQLAPKPKQNVSNAICNLLNKVNRHQSLEINQPQVKALAEKSYSSQKTAKDDNFLYYASSVIKSYFAQRPTKIDEVAKDHLVQTIQGLEYARNLKLSSPDEKIVNLPRSSFNKTIIFDLDETLIHCNENVNIPGDVILPITFPTGDIIQASINIRPFAQQVLQTLSRHFEIIVFTASHSCYANVVLDHLDPKRQWISHRLFRDHCLQSEEGAYIKDLRVLGNRKLSNLLLVDNASYSFGQQVENGIPIIAYYDNNQDQELLYLQNYLMKFRNVGDVRQLNGQLMKLAQYTNYPDSVDLLRNLFQEYLPK